MKKAEAQKGIAREQFGGRVGHSPDLQSLNIRIFYDQIILQQKPASSTFIDLVSNYDLVTHSIGSLALQRVGVLNAPIFCMFTTLQDMVHSVRTAYGDSINKYGGDL
eukprot:6320712-Ditylum_brightwellii.AAC.1